MHSILHLCHSKQIRIPMVHVWTIHSSLTCRPSSCIKILLLPLSLPMDVVIYSKEKNSQIVNRNIPFTLGSSWNKTARNSYNIEGNTFLSIDFPFTSNLKSNCLYLTKFKVNKILPISMSYLLVKFGQTALGSLGILKLMV